MRAPEPWRPPNVNCHKYFPQPGWVEHDPDIIWQDCVNVCRDAIAQANIPPALLAGIGITNQRETTILWDRATGVPVHNAIVWQDRRTEPLCERLESDGVEALVTARTGLLLDPYFSATKITWLLDNVDGARKRAEAGELAFGNYRLLSPLASDRRCPAFDRRNQRQSYHAVRHSPSGLGRRTVEDLRNPQCPLARGGRQYGIIRRDGHRPFRHCGTHTWYGRRSASRHNWPSLSFRRDDQRAPMEPDASRSSTPERSPVSSTNKLLTTTAFRLDGKAQFALEGSIFVAGAAVQWLRDGLGIIQDAAETAALAETADPGSGVYLVPPLPDWARPIGIAAPAPAFTV